MGNVIMGVNIYKILPVIVCLLTKLLESKKGNCISESLSYRYISEYEIMDILRTLPELQGKSEYELYQVAKRVKSMAHF